MRRTYNIHGQRVALTCGEEEAGAADFLAAVLRQEAARAPILAPGNRIQVGWNFFQVAEGEDGLEVTSVELTEENGIGLLKVELTYKGAAMTAGVALEE